MPPQTDDRPLIGRIAELDRVRSAVRLGRGALLVGSAGTGKSRLAMEVARHVATRGQGTATVRATEAAATLRLGAFASLVAAIDDRAGSELDLLRSAASAVADALGRRGVLVVDDVHLLDDTSLALVHHLATLGDPVVVATARTTPDPRPAVTALWKDGLLDRLDIEPLDEPTTSAMAASILGGPLVGSSARQLWELSLGNPLFVRELLLGAIEAGDVGESNGIWRFLRPIRASTRLHELLALRTGGRSEEERDALEVLAVAGWLPVSLLADVASADAVESLDRLGLLAIEPERGEPVARLVHPLYGEELRSGLGVLADARIRRRLADALEHRGATTTPT